MSGVDHREGGLANLGLSGRSRWVELNADGIHVNDTAMRIAHSCLPPEKLILTSDAVVSAGLPYGEYLYFGHKVRSDSKGVRYGESGVLIGSSKLGMEIVGSFVRASGAPLWAAVASMSATPSAALGKRARQRPGKIVSGAPAKILVWDKDMTACRRPLEPKPPRFERVVR
jgi:N-acetylglucosamine-6-phosphate deacetylase